MYKDLNRFDSSIAYYQKAYQLSLNTTDTLQYARVLNNWFTLEALNGNSQAKDSLFKAARLRQQLGDSKGLYSSYRNLAEVFHNKKQPQAAQNYADSALHLARQINSLNFLKNAYSLQMLLRDDTLLTDYQKVIDSFEKLELQQENTYASLKYNVAKERERTLESQLLQERERAGKQRYQAVAIIVVIIGVFVVYILRQRHKKAKEVEVYNTETRISKKVHDEVANDVYKVMTNLQGDIGNYKTSNEYYRKAQVIYEKLNLEDDLMAIKTNLAINLKNTGQYEEAIPLFKENIDYYSANNYNNDLAGAFDSLGQIYLATDSLSEAKRYFEKALTLSQQFGETSLIGLNVRNIGDVYMKENNPVMALDYYKRALAISQQTNTRKKMILDYKKLSEAYAALGNFKLAYEHYVDYHELHREILGKENIERMNALEIQYQSQKKELELIKKNSEIQLFKEREQRAGLQRLFLFIFLIVVIALAVSVIYGLRQKMKRNALKRDALNRSLEFKEKELTTHALHLAHKNEILLDLKSQLSSVKSDSKNARHYQNIINNINLDINNDSNWEQFRSYFEEVHKDFNSKIIKKYPEVSTNDLRLMSLLKMNLSSKEIASILNISPEGVKKARYRLRKKLNLSSEESLQELVIEL